MYGPQVGGAYGASATAQLLQQRLLTQHGAAGAPPLEVVIDEGGVILQVMTAMHLPLRARTACMAGCDERWPRPAVGDQPALCTRWRSPPHHAAAVAVWPPWPNTTAYSASANLGTSF